MSNKDSSDSSGGRKDVQLPGLSDQLKDRVERRITEHEETTEPAIFRGNDGIVPRIRPRDYVLEACVGIVLTLYFVIELLVV